jgi:hypothetical protein
MEVKDETTETLENEEIKNETPSENEEVSAESKENDSENEDEISNDENEEESANSKKDDGKRKGNRSIQKRIGRLKRREEEALREANFWKEKALENERAKRSNDTPKNETSEKPRPDDFETQEDYIEALTDWKTDRKFQEFEKGQEKKSAQQRENEFANSWQKKVQDFEDEAPDFQDVLEDVSHLTFSRMKLESIMESDVGPKLMYEIAQNEELAQKISEMSDTRAIREIGKIEARLLPSSETKTKKQTRAPKPITPIGGGGGKVKKDLYSLDISQKEYEAMRAQQRKARRMA